MIAQWRAWAIGVSAVLAIAGVALWAASGNPMLAIVGLVGVVTSLLERSYGKPKLQPAENMRPTDERFVDPETGQLVTVWVDPGTGERRYVAGDPS